MKIHLTGTHWHGAISENIESAFHDLGHEVFFFNKYLQGFSKILKSLALKTTRKPYETEYYFCRRRSKEWLNSILAYKPDLIFIDDAPPILAEFVKEARKLGKPIVYYVTSPPYGSGAKDQFLSFKYADHIFSIDTKWADLITAIYGVSVHHLPLGANPKHFYPILNEEKKFDVVYVASVPEQSPDGSIRAQLMSNIPAQFKVGIFGNGWRYWYRYFPELKNRVFSESALSISDLNKIYNQAKLIINFHSTGHDDSISSRIFEVSLAGGFILTDYRKDLDKLLPPNLFPVFKTAKDLHRLIGEWAPKDKERNLISKKAGELVLANHTWDRRIKEILHISMPKGFQIGVKSPE